jgi:hypothetical protein
MTISESALVTIAVASSIQTLVLAGAALLAFRAWSRVAEDLRRQMAAVQQALSDVLPHVRDTVGSIGRLSSEGTRIAGDTGRLLNRVSHAADAVASHLGKPRQLVAVAALAAARGLWRRRSRRPM